MTRLLCLLSFCVFASAATAGPFQYECTIESMMNDDGTNASGLTQMYRDEKVFIERETGIIMHRYWLQNKYDALEYAVLHSGNSARYYKAVTYTAGDTLIAVTVKEFAKGRRKPMALLVNGKVATGYCY